eukprot:scaffold10819_cov108-Isochrysis_galbana.AAC.5
MGNLRYGCVKEVRHLGPRLGPHPRHRADRRLRLHRGQPVRGRHVQGTAHRARRRACAAAGTAAGRVGGRGGQGGGHARAGHGRAHGQEVKRFGGVGGASRNPGPSAVREGVSCAGEVGGAGSGRVFARGAKSGGPCDDVTHRSDARTSEPGAQHFAFPPPGEVPLKDFIYAVEMPPASYHSATALFLNTSLATIGISTHLRRCVRVIVARGAMGPGAC